MKERISRETKRRKRENPVRENRESEGENLERERKLRKAEKPCREIEKT